MSKCTSCDYTLFSGESFCTACGAKVLSGVNETSNSSENTDSSYVDQNIETNNVDSSIALNKKLRVLVQKREIALKAVIEAEEKITAQEECISGLQDWHQANTNSFIWRVINKMSENLDEAQLVLRNYRKIVDELELPDPGVMHKLRKSFHRKLLATYTFIPALMAFLLYLPTLMLNIVGNPQLVRMMSYLRFATSRIYIYGIFSILLITTLSLIHYYRGWSTYQAKVNRKLWELEVVAQNTNSVRTEELRLKTIYPSVREWLEIIGYSLNKPWIIKDSWLQPSVGAIKKESLPYSLHVAQASEEDESAMLGMKRYTAEKFMIKGWRSRVFAEQVDVIREKMGLPSERLNIDELDKDIAFSPNGPRAVVASLIRDTDILEKVARKQIVPLTLEIQKEGIGNSRPPVLEVRSGQANVLKAESAEGQKDTTEWDEFLEMSFGDERRLVSPFSPSAFSDSGLVAGHQSRADSFFIVPQRLRGKIVNVSDRNIRSYSESSNLPMDISVRLDFTGPIPSEDIALLSKSESEIDEVLKKDASKTAKAREPRDSGI